MLTLIRKSKQEASNNKYAQQDKDVVLNGAYDRVGLVSNDDDEEYGLDDVEEVDQDKDGDGLEEGRRMAISPAPPRP